MKIEAEIGDEFEVGDIVRCNYCFSPCIIQLLVKEFYRAENSYLFHWKAVVLMDSAKFKNKGSYCYISKKFFSQLSHLTTIELLEL